MSIPAEPSLLQNEVQVTGPGGDVLRPDIADLSDLCPVIQLQTLEVCLLSMAKSHLHGALHSAHKSCTQGHVSGKRGGMNRELLASP